MKIIIKGKYYKKEQKWVAELPPFEMKASNRNPFLTLDDLKTQIEKDYAHEDLTLLVKDRGELLLVLPESLKAYDFIAKNLVTGLLDGIVIDDPLKEKE